MKTSAYLAAGAAGFLLLTSSIVSAAKVDEQVVGPVVEQQPGTFPYRASTRGSHLGTIARKGSRVVVNVDGVEGPRFDAILEPTLAYIDPRPYQDVDPNSLPEKTAIQFSRDGKRFAYVARQSQEWVVMVDNKESLRLPAIDAGFDFRVEFTGDEGKHFIFARAVYGGFEMWVDGQKWPGTFGSGGGGSDGTIDPVISPDGSRIAAVMQVARDKQALIVDGKDAGYMAVKLQFTADSKHLIGTFRGPKGGETLIIDGKPIGTAESIPSLFVGPVGSRMIAVVSHQNPDKTPGGYLLLVDGKPVPATLVPNASDLTRDSVIFSRDGKHWAAICGKPNTKYVVVDGKNGQEYQNIAANQPRAKMTPQFAFSPDGSKLVYVATSAGKQFLVVGEDESDAFEMFGTISIYFSPDGKRLAYSGATSGANSRLLIDGKVLAKAERGFKQFAFGGPDGAHYAYEANLDPNGTMLDGQPTEIACAISVDIFDYVFSPDGQHLAMFGFRAKDQKSGMFVDKEHITPSTGCRYIAFTPDSQHVFWWVSEFLGGGKHQWVVYLDGKPAAKFDAFGIFDKAYGYLRAGKVKTVPFGFDMSADGTLTCLGAVGDVVKRFTITPTADTNVTTMLNEAKAGGGKTKVTEADQHAVPRSPTAQPASPAPPTGDKKAVANNAPAANPSKTAPGNPAVTPQPDPVAEATKKATDKVDAAATRAKSFLESLTKKK